MPSYWYILSSISFVWLSRWDALRLRDSCYLRFARRYSRSAVSSEAFNSNSNGLTQQNAPSACNHRLRLSYRRHLIRANIFPLSWPTATQILELKTKLITNFFCFSFAGFFIPGRCFSRTRQPSPSQPSWHEWDFGLINWMIVCSIAYRKRWYIVGDFFFYALREALRNEWINWFRFVFRFGFAYPLERKWRCLRHHTHTHTHTQCSFQAISSSHPICVAAILKYAKKWNSHWWMRREWKKCQMIVFLIFN